jgi:hypothetical protein
VTSNRAVSNRAVSNRAVSALVAVLAVLLWAAPAGADPPARLTAQVTDPAGVLGAGRAAVDAAVDRLRAQTGVRLFVVFVPSFDDTPAQDWTDRAARLTGLDDGAALLAVATRDREYAYHFPAGTQITKGEAAAVARNDIEPALTRGDWSGAVVAGADGYREAATGSGSFTWVIVLAIVVIAAAGAGALLRRRRRGELAATADDARADALLVEVDNDVRARVAAGDDGEVVSAAQADLAEAFRLRMTLDDMTLGDLRMRQDDAPAADELTRSATVGAIIDLCASAAQLLDGAGGPATAEETDRRRVALEAAIPAAAAALQDLASRYAQSRVALVAANVDQARERLAFAADALLQARSTGNADALRTAAQAVDQANQLLAAIHRAVADGDTPELAALAAEIDDFISTRRGAVGVGPRTAIAEARRHLARATQVDGDDPRTSLAEAQLARSLTELAGQAALADVETWPGHGGTGGVARTGAMLGGLLPADTDGVRGGA